MKNIVKLLVVGLIAAGASACGRGGAQFAEGKEAAAQALFDSSQAADGTSSGHFAQDLRSAQSMSPITVAADIGLKCKAGGTATLKNVAINTSLESGVTADLGFDLVYAGCSHDGKTFRDGTMTVQKKVIATLNPVSVKVELAMKGQVDYSGEVEDFVKVDVVQTVSVEAFTKTSGQVSVVLNGSVENSTGKYVYVNETIDVTAGVLPAVSVHVGG